MIREIVLYGNPVLRKAGKQVGEVTDDVRQLADDMVETMKDANGVGLAAQQVGVAVQLAIVDVSHNPDSITCFRIDGKDAGLDEWMPLVFCNPELEFGEDKATAEEGCLSFPEIQADITRPESVTAGLTLLDGRRVVVETDGLLARAIQHEVDHLNGILYIDRMSRAVRTSLRGRLKRLQKGIF